MLSGDQHGVRTRAAADMMHDIETVYPSIEGKQSSILLERLWSLAPVIITGLNVVM